MTTREKLMLALLSAVATWFVFSRKGESGAFTTEKRQELIKFLAVKYGISPAVALAVFDVESGGKGFASDGRLIIRFEPHIFRKYTKKNTGKEMNVPTKRGGQSAEYQMLAKARALDDKSALESISMGSSQIMGFNHKIIGYGTVQEMWHAFNQSEAAHIRGFFAFVNANKKLLQAAKTKDFKTFAYYYNGPGGVGVYDPKMIARYNYWKGRV